MGNKQRLMMHLSQFTYLLALFMGRFWTGILEAAGVQMLRSGETVSCPALFHHEAAGVRGNKRSISGGHHRRRIVISAERIMSCY